MFTLKSMLVAALIAGCAIATPAAANAAALHVKNLSNKTIALLYISPSDDAHLYPEDQRLGRSQYIRPGELWNLSFDGRNECDFDLFAVFTDRSIVHHYDANLCSDDGSPMIWTIW
jgi:hypothetical protein